jgi:hypothetical protein
MFQVEFDKSQNLLRFVFAQKVTTDETQRWREKVEELMHGVQPGFQLLNDMSGLELMDPACAADIEFGMELLDKAGIAKVVRVITHPRQDIGLSIMSLFHYRRRIPIVTCQTLDEALKILAG